MTINGQTRLKETFVNKGTNAAAVGPSETLAIASIKSAQQNDNLPHHAFVISNQSSSCILYIFLDDYSDATKPDYVLQANQVITVGENDGVSFSTLFVRNTHAVNDVAIAELKYRISTLKEGRYKKEI